MDILNRVKWKPVAILLVVILVAGFFLLSGQNIKAPFQESWKTVGDIQMMSWSDPTSVEVDGTSKAKVEVKNSGKETANVTIRLAALSNDKSLSFPENDGSQNISTNISIGPNERRELSFKVDFNATYAGKYGVKVTVSPGGENIVDEIFFEVKEKNNK